MTSEAIADIVKNMRYGAIPKHRTDHELLALYANRIEATCKSEAQAMERIVRDAIISYSELFSDAPGDDAERELKERAARANAWLASHGFAEEKVIWSKEESPCL